MNELFVMDGYIARDVDLHWPVLVRFIYEQSVATAFFAYAAIVILLAMQAVIEYRREESCCEKLLPSGLMPVVLILLASAGILQLENLVVFYWPVYTLFSYVRLLHAVFLWGVVWVLFAQRKNLPTCSAE